MPDLVRRVDFSPDLMPAVADFDCGSEEWAVEVSAWIRGADPENSVVADMVRGTRVWLYVNARGRVVGFGSLGQTTWRWPGPKDPKQLLAIIPMFAVRSDVRGLPKGEGETAYAVQIFGDLVAEARLRKDTHPLLGLFVHERNDRAVRFYKRFGFALVDNRRGYDRMVLAL